MTSDKFKMLDDELMQKANEILAQRGKGYGEQHDRLANFKGIAEKAGVDVSIVWIVFMEKGMDVIRKLMKGRMVPGERINERFADAINYLRLGRALLEERRLDDATGA